MASSEFLKFKVGDMLCALPIARVREVLPMVELVRPPRRPRILEGYLNLGGTAVPVLRLDRLLGVAERDLTSSDHLLVLRGSDRPVALHVERALELTQVGQSNVLAGDLSRFSPTVTNEIRLGDTSVHVLDIDRLLAEVERNTIDELALETQKRLVAWRGDAA